MGFRGFRSLGVLGVLGLGVLGVLGFRVEGSLSAPMPPLPRGSPRRPGDGRPEPGRCFERDWASGSSA